MSARGHSEGMDALEPATVNELVRALAYLLTALGACVWAALERRGRLNEARRPPRRRKPSLIASLRPPPADPSGNSPSEADDRDSPTNPGRKHQ
jgi:hypothetical protein